MEKINKFFDFNNILGFISFLLSIIALYYMGVPDRIFYWIFSLSLFLQAIVFYRTKQWFLILQMIMLLGFNIINYFRWIEKGIG
jgi:hypothetical protein